MSAQRILVVDDEPEIRNAVKDILEDEGFEVSVAESAAAAREERKRQPPDLVLLDIWMPEEDGVSLLKDWKQNEDLQIPVVMMSGHGTVETAVEATRHGAFDFIEKPLSLAKLLRVTTQALESASANRPASAPRIEVIEPVGTSPQMQQLREQIQRAAQHDTWVMLTGEAGSGKSMVARYIHANSARAEKPFVELATTGLEPEEIHARLFGQDGQPGLLEQANGGTLYINEVANLDVQTQALLVNALEQKGITRDGRKIPLDLRIMASTQHDLNQRVADGSFREDLYYHLNVLPLRLPALREHAEDIPELLAFYVDYFNTYEGLEFRHFTLAAQNYLRYYSWPGNVRQLRNLVQRLLVMGEGEEISQDEAEEALLSDRVAQTQEGTPDVLEEAMDLPLREAREVFEREYLVRQLEKCHGNVSRLAERVGMERTHLYRKMRALGVNPKRK